jgi:hypothetical protein
MVHTNHISNQGCQSFSEKSENFVLFCFIYTLYANSGEAWRMKNTDVKLVRLLIVLYQITERHLINEANFKFYNFVDAVRVWLS